MSKLTLGVRTVSGGFLAFYGLLYGAWLLQSGPLHPMTIFFCVMTAAAAGLVLWREWARRMMVTLSGTAFLLVAADAALISRHMDRLTIRLLLLLLAGWFFYGTPLLRSMFSSGGSWAGTVKGQDKSVQARNKGRS